MTDMFLDVARMSNIEIAQDFRTYNPSSDYMRVFERKLVTLYECADHGFVAWSLQYIAGPRCRECGRRSDSRFSATQVDKAQTFRVLDHGNKDWFDPYWRTYRGKLVLRHSWRETFFVGWAPFGTEFGRLRSPVVDLPYDHISQVPPLE